MWDAEIISKSPAIIEMKQRRSYLKLLWYRCKIPMAHVKGYIIDSLFRNIIPKWRGLFSMPWRITAILVYWRIASNKWNIIESLNRQNKLKYHAKPKVRYILNNAMKEGMPTYLPMSTQRVRRLKEMIEAITLSASGCGMPYGSCRQSTSEPTYSYHHFIKTKNGDAFSSTSSLLQFRHKDDITESPIEVIT